MSHFHQCQHIMTNKTQSGEPSVGICVSQNTYSPLITQCVKGNEKTNKKGRKKKNQIPPPPRKTQHQNYFKLVGQNLNVIMDNQKCRLLYTTVLTYFQHITGR